MINGVTIGDKHSSEFNLILVSKTISAPEVQTKKVSVPGRNGDINLSTVLTGDVRYKNRSITMKFINKDVKYDDIPIWKSEIENYLHGQKMRIVFDDDPAFYYYGSLNVEPVSYDGVAQITIKADVDPYKYSITTSEEDWLWDPFDFEQSVINETADLVVDGSLEVSIIAGKKWDNPIVISDSDMTVAFKGSTYQIKAGSQVMYDIILEEGENILTFTGNGKVTINYVGGML